MIYRAGSVHHFEASYVDGLGDPAGGLSPALSIQFVKAGDDETGWYWNGAAWQSSPTTVSMVETDATGTYVYELELRAGDHADDGAYYILSVTPGSTSAYPKNRRLVIDPQPSEADAIAIAALADLGDTLGPERSVKRAWQMAGQSAEGTTRHVQSGNRDFIETLGPDRATVYGTREALPAGGPYETLKQHGDHTIRLPAAQIGFGAQQLFTSAGIQLPPAQIEFAGQTPTIPVQLPPAQVEFEGRDPNVQWV